MIAHHQVHARQAEHGSSTALARRMASSLLKQDAGRFGGAIWDAIRPEAEAALASGNDQRRLREWHGFLLDLRSALSAAAPAIAGQIAALAQELRSTAFLARRNPPGEAMQRPASRRLLRTLGELGGTDCPLSRVREMMDVSMPNLANMAKPLIAHGLVRRSQDPRDARQALLSLTKAGRSALQATGAHQEARFSPLKVVPVEGCSSTYRVTMVPRSSSEDRTRQYMKAYQ